MNDPMYAKDIARAEADAQSWRHAPTKLQRVLWMLNEKQAWNLIIGARLLELATADAAGDVLEDEQLASIIATLSELTGVSGEAASLNLTLGSPEPNA